MKKQFLLLCLPSLLLGCATYKTKYTGDNQVPDRPPAKEVAHTFYLIGDAGLSPKGTMNPALKAFQARLAKADSNSTAIFLGDNIYPAGLPDPGDSTQAYLQAKNNLDAQLQALTGFPGRPLFIPGNHDWYNEGPKGLEREAEYIRDALGDKDVFMPDDGCPLQTVEIGEKLTLIVIDTEWYLTNWDRHPTMNDKCEIKSREKFMEELEGLIKENRSKTTLIVLHHPMFSYGSHDGQYSLKQQIYPAEIPIPLPILGSVINIFRRTTGASIEDLQNKRYRELRKQLVTLAQYSDKVILASGHEHTLQYIIEDHTPQIVSGAGSKTGATRLVNGSRFASGRLGYAVLQVYRDGSSEVGFYSPKDGGTEDLLFTTRVLPADRTPPQKIYPDSFPAAVRASVYRPEEVEKGWLFRKIWGERYRRFYGVKVRAHTVNLDTLFGGLEPIRKGGGHQSRSLRLRHKSGKEYVMRALKKSAELYLQTMAFKDQYVVGQFEDTYTEDVLLDFYTGSHPYAPFTIGELSDAVGLYHTNPVLYYVPKQPALKEFNEEFGDELYMIEEHAGDGHGDLKSFGYSDELKSTDSMLDDLRDDEKYSVDTRMYLRARLFDMVIGDWDRHVDQWRWAEFRDKDKGTIQYKPVPRDRDMAYSEYGDGWLMQIANRIIPGLRVMESYGEAIRSVRGFNSEPLTHVLDLALLSETTPQDWMEEAAIIRKNITPEVIDKAFEHFPEAVRDTATLSHIKQVLLSRASHIQETARKYYDILNRVAVVTGTDKDDWFEINCVNGEEVEISAYRIIGGKKRKQFFHKVFSQDVTREIWVYGLDDDDRFEVKGPGDASIKIRLIGGQNNDIYDIGNANPRVYIYDYKSRKNTFMQTGNSHVRRLDDYEVNTYRPLNFRTSSGQYLPTLGYNPDDGIKLGLSATYTYNGFRQNPFTQQHHFNAAFYFATAGFEFGYKGEFANITENWNLELEGRFTSPNFSMNFFGFGNESPNLDDDLGLDYNRVKLETIRFAPSMVWRGQLGAKLRAGLSFETIEVERTAGRFINDFYGASGEDTRNNFIGAHAEYSYENRDNQAFPTLGMGTSLLMGYKRNTSDGSRDFAYIVPDLSLDYKVVPNGRLVLATRWKAQFNLGDGYEFYQAAHIGARDGLRGYRFERFTGKTSYYQQTDLRLSLNRLKTAILPLNMGIYGGFDYGRVWYPGDLSRTWHTSYGGGFFLNGADILTTTLALFNSDDGLRFSFGLGFGF